MFCVQYNLYMVQQSGLWSQTRGVMGYSCVNKHGMFAQGQSFGRNVILNCSDCRWHMHSPGSGRPQLHLGAHILRGIPVILSSVPASAESGYVPKMTKAGGLNQQLTSTSPKPFLTVTIQTKKLVSPPGEMRQEKREAVQAIKAASIGSAALGAQRNRACFSSNRSPTPESRPQLSWDQEKRSGSQSFAYGFINLLKLIIGFVSPSLVLVLFCAYEWMV